MSTPLLDPYYRAEVEAGPHSWTVEKGDAPDYGLADPLIVGWSLPNKPLFHAQPDAMRATFSVIAEAMADIAITRDTAVVIRIYGWPPGTANPHAQADDLDPVNYPPIVTFRGTVVDIDAKPHKLGMVLTYICSDPTTPLAENVIGADDWPTEGNSDRFVRMFDEAGIVRPPASIPFIPAWFMQQYNVVARSGSASNARNLIWNLVDQVTHAPEDPSELANYHYMTTNYAAGYLAGDVLDPSAPYLLKSILPRHLTGDLGEAPRLPGVFGETVPGKYGVVIQEHATRRAAVINADHVSFKAAWSQTKQTDPDTVTVTGAFVDTLTSLTATSATVQAPGAAPVAASLQADTINLGRALDYAAANCTGADSDKWTADTFTWYADQDPWPMIADAYWFVEGMHVEAGRAPVVIHGIDPTKTPNGLNWWTGRLRSATFTLAKGRYSVQFKLLRNLLRPQVNEPGGFYPNAGVWTLTTDDLRASHPAVSTVDLDRAYTAADYRLLRSS